MQDVDLFMSLAEIAGILVGFAALIAIRGGAVDPVDIVWVGMVVWIGAQAVAAAIVPVAISRFGVAGHDLWLASSLIVLAVWWIVDEGVRRMSPERRAVLSPIPRKTRLRYELVGVPFWVPMNVALILVVLGLSPDQEPALHFVAVVLLLLLGLAMLLMIVTCQGRPRSGATTG